MKTPPGRLFVKMGEDNAFNWAVIIAWNFLQSLFPIALVMAAVLGVGLGFIGVSSRQVYGTVASIIPDASAQKEVLATLNTFHQKSGIFLLVGFAGLVWSGASLFRTMEQGFAVIYHTRQRPLLKGILMSVGMVLLLTVFGALMLVTTTLLGLLNQLPYLPAVLANGPVDFVLQVVLGVGAGFLLFLAIYYVVPNRRMDWGKVWIGAALAGVLFEALSLVFPLYLRLTGGGSTYGKTFGLLFLLMIYFYLLGNVTMVGVEVNSLLYRVPVDQPQGKESLVTPT
jgi:membrane protein